MNFALQDTLYVLVAIWAATVVLAFVVAAVGASIKKRIQRNLHDEIRNAIQETKRETDNLYEKINTVTMELDQIRKRVG